MKYNNLFFMLLIANSTNLLTFKLPEFKKITSLFKKQKVEKIIEKEYSLEKSNSLKVCNTLGNITIASEWEQPVVRLKATIKGSKQEDLELITINNSCLKKSLALATNAPENNSCQVHYELIVPKKVNLSLITHKGDMSVAESSGPLYAETEKGNIVIEHAKNIVIAQTNSRGNITINDAQGAVKAYTKKGNILIENAHNSIAAHTENGIVRTAHSILPHTGNINLESDYGNIVVALPASTNAMIRAKTEHGSITSDHFLTLKSQTTKLDPKTWSRFKKEVDATIGSGEASIQLTCKNGAIKLLDNSVTS